MKIASINNNNSYIINTLNDFENKKDEILQSIDIISLPDKPPKDIINDIIKVLFLMQDNKQINAIDTYIIYKKDNIEYCMFVYQTTNKSLDDKNKIISRLIDNSEQMQYNEENALNHNNKAVICKIDGKNLYDITKEELLEIIQNAFICNALLITPDKIINYYYKNNPVYGLNGFDVYTTMKFMEGELLIFLNHPEVIVFENNIEFDNKDLYKGIFDKWNIFKEKNKIPLNVELLISYHKENINIPISEEIKEKIIQCFKYKYD